MAEREGGRDIGAATHIAGAATTPFPTFLPLNTRGVENHAAGACEDFLNFTNQVGIPSFPSMLRGISPLPSISTSSSHC